MVYDTGETAGTLDKRLTENQKQTTSAVCEHKTKTSHSIDWEEVKFFNQESVDSFRKIKEATRI